MLEALFPFSHMEVPLVVSSSLEYTSCPSDMQDACPGNGCLGDAAIIAVGKQHSRWVSQLWTFLVLFLSAGAFNLDVQNAEVITDPSRCGGSLFGYAVALLREKGVTWVLVGAPKGGQDCQGSVKSLSRGGVMYKCRTDGGSDPCLPIPLPEMENYTHDGLQNVEGTMAGWTIDVEDIEDGKIVVCAPHWMDSPSQCDIRGTCFWLSGTESEARKLPPIKQEIPATREDFDCHANARAGFSAHIVKKSAEIIIGAPWAFNGHGAVARYRDDGKTMVAQVSTKNSSIAYSNSIVSKPFLTQELKNEPYFGYSISSGKFSRTNKTFYVSSAPRSSSLKGKVFIFDFPEKPEEPISIKFELEGFQLGEYFGYSICVVDLNSDGLDDLVIGAPHHSLGSYPNHISKHSWDEGRVYVFMNRDGALLADYGVKIMGTIWTGARFGTAISNIGDVNIDGYSDIAVGAPYENFGHGSVYVYHGSRDGLNPQFVQKISAAEIHHSLMGFGMAISRGTDVDGNNYNDIAIGAHLSGNVVLLKSRPIIKFETSLISNFGKMDANANGFLRVCSNYSGIQAPLSLVAAVTLSAKTLAKEVTFVVNNTKHKIYSYYPELKTSSMHCDRFGLEIREVFKGSSLPIKINMDFKIALEREVLEIPPGVCLKRNSREDKKNYCLLSPMVDPALPKSSILILSPPPNCGDDHVCMTDIESKVTVSGVMIPFIVGSRKFMKMKVIIKNNKGPASLVKTRIIFSRITPLKSIPQICQEYPKPGAKFFTSLLVCDISNLMAKKEQRHLHLIFYMKNIPSNHEKLIYKIISTTAGEDLHPENNDKKIIPRISVLLQKQYYPAGYYTISHVYEAYTLGPSPLNLARFIFKVPTFVETPLGTEKFLKVYHPQTYDGYPSIVCSTEYDSSDDKGTLPHKVDTHKHHEMKMKYGGIGEFQNMMGMYHSKARKKRIRRAYEYMEEEEDDNSQLGPVPISRAFHVDCSQPPFKCTMLYCIVGPMHASITRAVITIPMELHPAIAEKLFEQKDLIILHSSGGVTAEDISSLIQPAIHKPDFVNVSTTFFAKYEEAEFDIWILLFILSGGTTTLFLIILLLFKVGFFERQKRRELQILKLRLTSP